MRVSYCVPTHDHPRCEQYMFDILYALSQQSYKDFELCVSHQGDDDKILRSLNDYWDILNITYRRAPEGNISVNTNNAMKMGEGDIIKILYSDDFILTSNLTEELDKAFTSDVSWAVTGFAHTLDNGLTHYNPKIPFYNDRLLEGINTLSSPSILAMRRDIKEYFDENLVMLMDCDMYYRLYENYGNPIVINDIHISNREHQNQTQRTYEHLLPEEIDYLKKKHSS
tara:strand:- start:253 stop:930 length:678 start_codon:yes stop_codon:yes gene_type:complete